MHEGNHLGIYEILLDRHQSRRPGIISQPYDVWDVV